MARCKPRVTARPCKIIISIVTPRVEGNPCSTMPTESPTKAMSQWASTSRAMGAGPRVGVWTSAVAGPAIGVRGTDGVGDAIGRVPATLAVVGTAAVLGIVAVAESDRSMSREDCPAPGGPSVIGSETT